MTEKIPSIEDYAGPTAWEKFEVDFELFVTIKGFGSHFELATMENQPPVVSNAASPDSLDGADASTSTTLAFKEADRVLRALLVKVLRPRYSQIPIGETNFSDAWKKANALLQRSNLTSLEGLMREFYANS